MDKREFFDALGLGLVWAFLSFWGISVLVTGYWTISGHCCGIPDVIPVVGMTEWDRCEPIQDTYRETRWLSPHTHCEWGRRVPDFH